ncbi:phenylalanine--tRNA ligase subunit beta [Candidatus Roizmanbacteria bacterium]|nr:phenylalanine--tRNA ligase subunit beta [Candidatus Roizmanbacteria bacterium]
MNLKITHDWLLEYLDTDAAPSEIQKYLSLCGPSVEKVTKIDDDYVYDIEITSNRVDTASVFGIAQEALAILPQFAKRAKLKFNPLKKYRFENLPSGYDRTKMVNKLIINIQEKNICPRFTALVLNNIQIKKSPKFVQSRLQLCGIKSINNVVDISNYLMIAFGQPVHIFDYERISKSTMNMRLSRKGEKIVTLDGKVITLPGDDIVIEDGDKKLIDLCGIMGGLNSSVTGNTNTVVLFVQTYNPQKVRETSMSTGQRTLAAAYFEKGLDEERVEPTTVYGVELLQVYAGAKIASTLYDIYPAPYKSKKISISLDEVNKKVGIKFSINNVVEILTSLEFTYHIGTNRAKMILEVPSYRSRDVSIKEDLIEEIARIYGYYNLPNNIQPTVYIKQPKDIEQFFKLQSRVKNFLKDLGLHEIMNYSMISKELINKLGLSISDHLRVKNTISEEIEYMRRYITSSLIKTLQENEGKREILKFFEIAKGYKPRKNDLPLEYYQLSIATNTSINDLKGIIETLFRELNIEDYSVRAASFDIFEPKIQGEIRINNRWVGKFGQLKTIYKIENELKSEAYIAYFKFEELIKDAKMLARYKPISPYSVIKLDLTFEQDAKRPFLNIKEEAFKTSKLLKKIEFVGTFKNKATLRFYFSSSDRNISEDEAKKELEKIKLNLKATL